jgi:hypothetical protein
VYLQGRARYVLWVISGPARDLASALCQNQIFTANPALISNLPGAERRHNRRPAERQRSRLQQAARRHKRRPAEHRRSCRPAERWRSRRREEEPRRN